MKSENFSYHIVCGTGYHTLLYNSKSNFSALTLRLLRTRKCGVSFENVEDALMTTLIIQNYLSGKTYYGPIKNTPSPLIKPPGGFQKK